jgi:hypothetical protein
MRILLLLERSGVKVSVSSNAIAGGGCVSRSTEMGDLPGKYPMIKLIRNVIAKSDERRGGGRLTRPLQWLAV